MLRLGGAAVTDNARRSRSTARTGHLRRRLLAVGVVVAWMALAESAAWAFHLKADSLKVFNQTNYPSGTCATVGSPAGSACSKVTSGSQSGMATVDTSGDDVLHVAGGGYTTSDIEYSIYWRHPGVTADCHVLNPDGSVVMMGGTFTASSDGTIATTRTAITTTGRTPATGLARVCVQYYSTGTGVPTPEPTSHMVDIDVV